jgi:hypothetical protein
MEQNNNCIFVVCSVNKHTQLRYLKTFKNKNKAIQFWKEKTHFNEIPSNIEKGYELYLGDENIYFLKEKLI